MSFKDIVSNKLKSSYPNFVKKNIELVSINKNKSIPIGTMSYAYTQYPSDIDVFEEVDQGGHNSMDVITFFEKSIQNIVKRIMKMPYYWILEVKVGIDYRYNFKIEDKDACDKIRLLYGQGLLENEDLQIIDEGDEEANELLRKYSILRWTPQEIISGFKILPGNKVIRLSTAIKAKSQINIEVIGLINNKFMDLSNFFVLVYIDQLGNKHAINLPEESITNFNNFFVENLTKAINKLYYSELNRDYYKLTKRYWSLGKFLQNTQYLKKKGEILTKKMIPFVNSPVAIAGQKRSELGTLIKLIEHTQMEGVPKDIFSNQVSNIKLSLASVINLGFAIIDEINNDLDKVASLTYNTKDMVIILKGVKDLLSRFVSNSTLSYLKKVKLAPPPKNLII